MKTANGLLCVSFVSLLVSGSTAAVAEDAGPRIERAYLVGSIEALERVRADLETAAEGAVKAAARYDSAFAAWRLSDLLRDVPKSKKRRQLLLKRAREELEELVDLHPEDAEALALLGGVLGEMIGKNIFRGMSLGPRATAILDRAADLAPRNPRVALQRGVSYFFTPGLFGGGTKEAIRELERAKHLFEEESAKAPWPNWGRIDTYGWLAEVLAEEGREEEARALLEKALALEPDSIWIRDLLQSRE